MKGHLPLAAFSIIALLFFAQCSPEPGSASHIKKVTGALNARRMARADENPGDWMGYGRNYAEDRFSPLTLINRQNIDSLELVWSVNLGTKRGIEATPLVVDGVMFLSGPWSKVFAIDTRKGEMIWEYDPKVPGEYGEKACCDVVNRGVAAWKGKIYVGTLDGRLVALDAASGTPVWEILTVDTTKYYTITGAPRVVKGRVIIGNGGADYGVRGYITAYDAETGQQLWRFYTVPGDPSKPFESKAMETAAKTWSGEWWKNGGGGTAWDAIVFDPDLNLLYVGTGNGSPWNRQHRSPGGGDNLYLSSILALNPDNGELVWHYQTTPGDTWDFTATQPLILADLQIGGRLRKTIMQAPKNGFFYVLDRTNGEFISAAPYVYVNWAKGIDPATGRPMENDFSRYEKENAQVLPGPVGGHNWQPMAFNRKTGLVYIPVHDYDMYFSHDATYTGKVVGTGLNTGLGWDASRPLRLDSLAPKPTPQGRLIAWNPVSQKEVWQIKHPHAWNGGVLTTASGIVFQGTANGRFVAYDADNGKILWEINLGTGIIAAPVTYLVDGRQYVSIAVGWGGVMGRNEKFTENIYPGTVYTFTIGGKFPLPDYPASPKKELAKFEHNATEEDLAEGGLLYGQYCSWCHGGVGEGGGIIPDLGYSSKTTFDNFEAVVLKGALLSNGMPNFSGRLDTSNVRKIKNWVLSEVAKK